MNKMPVPQSSENLQRSLSEKNIHHISIVKNSQTVQSLGTRNGQYSDVEVQHKEVIRNPTKNYAPTCSQEHYLNLQSMQKIWTQTSNIKQDLVKLDGLLNRHYVFKIYLIKGKIHTIYYKAKNVYLYIEKSQPTSSIKTKIILFLKSLCV